MRYVLYFVIYSCMIISLFITFLYLMTVVDPGLLQLPEKAARFMKANAKLAEDSPGELPSEMYIDFSELFNRSRKIITISY
uniref:SFRICE_020271 n=1 Tax=Spodoptera frugiperda TaxID=7108 RepID=A0A2H1WFG9_SPOFR